MGVGDLMQQIKRVLKVIADHESFPWRAIWAGPTGKNAGGVAKMLVAKGSLSVWQYAVHKSATGDLEQAPLHRIGLIATDALRVDPMRHPLKVLPIDETKK